MKLVRDILDQQILDRNGHEMGKVDGILIELRDGQPPRLAFIEQGGPAPWRRLSPRLGALVERLGQRWSVRGGKVYRIPWEKTRDIGVDVEVDLDADNTPALAWEKWLAEHLHRHLPGARG